MFPFADLFSLIGDDEPAAPRTGLEIASRVDWALKLAVLGVVEDRGVGFREDDICGGLELMDLPR